MNQDNFNRPFLIAITGGIASGKTVICKWFESKNIVVFYADKLAHTTLQEDDIRDILIEYFGKDILQKGKIDREILGKKVFDDPEKLTKLNKVIHPEVRRKIHEIIMFSDAEYLVFEIPLLFETGMQAAFDLSINVFTDKTKQFERVLRRDELSFEQTSKRIEAQMNSFDKQKLADINIENNGTITELNNKMNNLWQLIKKLKKKDVKDILKIQ